MKKQVYGRDGKQLREIDLADAVFDRQVSRGGIYHAIRNELANQRQGTASVKTRAEVRGSSRKPYRQKGTGRARAGHRRSPIWVGGGRVFGPSPRDFGYRLPRKMKRLALKSILSLKSKQEELRVIEDFSVESGKTKDLVSILRNLVPAERTVIILKDDDQMLKRAGRNVPWLSFLAWNRLRAHDIFYGKHVLLLESAAAKLNELYGDG